MIHNHNFTLKQTKEIEMLNVIVYIFEHNRIGTTHVHLKPLKPHNQEKCFLVNFKTLPQDDTGVAHILEHMVLCGSKKYPVRDPFFSMMKRSLQTFMNAFTGYDYTAYPFATENIKDFYNLLDVYLDATFFSNISKESFLQEGWRFEFNEKNQLDYAGIVLNEMRGHMSSPVLEVWQSFKKHFKEGSTYQFNSGGDPLHITDLSYDKLKQFYNVFYHPSNAKFFTFGDFDIKEFQDKIDNDVLSAFEKIDVNKKLQLISDNFVGLEAKVLKNKKVIEEIASSDDTNHVVLSWSLNKASDIKETFKNQILINLLIGDSAAPILNEIENSNYGIASELMTIDDSCHDVYAVLGVAQVKDENVDDVISLIKNKLKKVAEEGVERDRIESILMHYEMANKEIKGSGLPYGLEMITNVMNSEDLVNSLNIANLIEDVREEVLHPSFVKEMIEKYFLNNSNNITFVAKGNPKLSEIRKENELKKLKSIQDSLSKEDTQKIKEDSLSLNKLQDSVEDLEVLPKIKVEDIDLISKNTLNNSTSTVKNMNVYEYNQETNGIAYFNMIYSIPKLSSEELRLLAIYTNFFGELGVKNKNYEESQVWQNDKTSGVSVRCSMDKYFYTNDYLSSKIIVSSKSLNRNVKDLIDVVVNAFEGINFNDTKRIKFVIESCWKNAEQSFIHIANKLAYVKAASLISKNALLTEKNDGLDAYLYLKTLFDNLENKKFFNGFVNELKSLHNKIIKDTKEILIIADEKTSNKMKKLLDVKKYVKPNEKVLSKNFDIDFEKSSDDKFAILIPNSTVNFISKVYKVSESNDLDSAKLQVLSNFFKNNFLHKEIREKGGAYGASCNVSNGVFSFGSYKDPNISKTLISFENCINWFLNNEHDKSLLDEAIINCIQVLDRPQTPMAEARNSFQKEKLGITKEFKDNYRKTILNTTIEDLKNMTEKYLLNKESKVVISSSVLFKEELEKENFKIITI